MSVPASFMEDMWIRRTFGIAGYTFLVWDHLLTFEDEFRYIWKAPWTVSKAMFLVNRYGNLACQTFVHIEETGSLSHGSTTWCSAFKLFIVAYVFVATESIHILVLVRAWAIWGCTRRVAVSLLALYTAYLLLTLMLIGFGTRTIHHRTFPYLAEIGVCVGYTPKYSWTVFLASLVLDTTVFAITMRSLREHSRVCRHLYPSHLLIRLFKDATIFFLVGALNNILYIIMWTVYATRPQYFIYLTTFLPLLSLTGQRLVLNLRGLQTRTYTTGELGREVDRQIMAFEVGDGVHDWYAPPTAQPDEAPDHEVDDVDIELVAMGGS